MPRFCGNLGRQQGWWGQQPLGIESDMTPVLRGTKSSSETAPSGSIWCFLIGKGMESSKNRDRTLLRPFAMRLWRVGEHGFAIPVLMLNCTYCCAASVVIGWVLCFFNLLMFHSLESTAKGHQTGSARFQVGRAQNLRRWGASPGVLRTLKLLSPEVCAPRCLRRT